MDAISTITLIFALLIVFQVKHFLSDFPLQFQFMLRKKCLPGWDFLGALTLHCAVHASFTLLIALLVNPRMWWLAGIDFGVHFVMDRIKSGPRYLGRFNDVKRPAFWNCLGIDQMVHHCTDYFIIWQLVNSVHALA